MASLLALIVAYLLGGLTFIPLLIGAGLYAILYVTPPVGDPDPAKRTKNALQASSADTAAEDEKPPLETQSLELPPPRLKPLQGWLVARRTFEESPSDATYMGMMRSFLDSRSKDRRPRDTYYAVLKGTVLYLYEDEAMSECFAALDAGAYTVEVWPHDGLLDGELFAKRNSIRLSVKTASTGNSPASMNNVSKDMKLGDESETTGEEVNERKEKANKAEITLATERLKKRSAAFDLSQPWYLFIKNNSDMEDWYLALIQASSPVPAGATDSVDPLGLVFSSADMAHLVATLDAQPDAIPTRWLNALLGRLFFSVYRTAKVEAYILGRLANKLAKVKRPGFLTALSVREVSVGSRPPTIATPMLKELTPWGDAALELKFLFDGEMRLTIAATAEVSLGARFRPYVVQLVLAVVIRKIEGNVLVKVKRPPSNRIWYAFTSMPKLEIDVLPVVSDREIKWGVVLKPIETQLKEIIRESIVIPNMDDIPFFESTGYEHRGGIWPDAVRRQYNPENDDPSTAPKTEIELATPPDPSAKTSSSAPPSIVGLATEASQPQSTPNLPSSESTPALPLSPKSRAAVTSDEPAENLAPAPNTVRSRTPSPVSPKADSAEDKETGSQKVNEKEKDKVVAATEAAPSPKRTSWFSRTPLSISSTSSGDSTRGRIINTGSGPSGTKPTAASARGRSTPRSPLLLEVEAGETVSMERGAGSPAPNPIADGTSTTSTQVDTSTKSESASQDAPDNQSQPPNDPAPPSNGVASRSATPILTVNGTRRTTISHQVSQSASGNFYSGGSASSSSPPPEAPPTTDGEAVNEPVPETLLASAPSAASSSNTPSDAPSIGLVDPNELTRTQSDSSAQSLSTPRSLPVSITRTSVDTPISPLSPHDASSPNNATNPTSLFSTWKTRATDKQALSNTAKEAMKKWSVGWNNLKRNVEEERERRRTNNNTGGPAASSGSRGDTSGADDDGSSSDAGMSGTGSVKKGAAKKTFAELRAEVMSRREGAPAIVDTQDVNPSGQCDPTFSGGISPKPRQNSISVAPSAPRTTTEVHIGTTGLFGESVPVIEQPKPKPIGVQPGRGATMMIPGIHASHQGEVMALGSAPVERESMNKDDDKGVERERTLSQNGRPSSIQNVYRLFGQRTMSTSSTEVPSPSSGSIQIIKQPKAAASSASIDTISVTPVDEQPSDSPFSPSTPRSSTPVPPLPPQLAPDMSPPASRPPAPPLPPRKQSTTISAASEALKKLAAEDAARTSRPQSPQVLITSEENTSGTSTPNGPHRPVSPPPLPPRAPATTS